MDTGKGSGVAYEGLWTVGRWEESTETWTAGLVSMELEYADGQWSTTTTMDLRWECAECSIDEVPMVLHTSDAEETDGLVYDLRMPDETELLEQVAASLEPDDDLQVTDWTIELPDSVEDLDVIRLEVRLPKEESPTARSVFAFPVDAEQTKLTVETFVRLPTILAVQPLAPGLSTSSTAGGETPWTFPATPPTWLRQVQVLLLPIAMGVDATHPLPSGAEVTVRQVQGRLYSAALCGAHGEMPTFDDVHFLLACGTYDDETVQPTVTATTPAPPYIPSSQAQTTAAPALTRTVTLGRPS